tara:strand:+ start:37 stop:1191 length:1155 start_codon:yes stop_codon:yes gene_type:complete
MAELDALIPLSGNRTNPIGTVLGALSARDAAAQKKELGSLQIENIRSQIDTRRAEESRAVATEQREIESAAYQEGIERATTNARILKGLILQGNIPDAISFINQNDTGAGEQEFIRQFLDPANPDKAKKAIPFLDQAIGQAGKKTTEERDFDRLTSELTPEEVLKAKKIELGLTPRATGAAAKTVIIGGVPHIFNPTTQTFSRVKIEGEDVTTESVGESKASIAKQVRLAEQKASQSVKLSGEAFANLQRTKTNINNLDKGIALIDQGAGVGAIEDLFPSFKQATVELKNLQGQLGLDIIGGTTFGALSENELLFALKTALPTGLDSPDLRRWMVAKKVAQAKLIDEFSQAVEFLGKGNDIADFIAIKELESVEDRQSNVQVDF